MRLNKISTLLLALGLSAPAFATDGYFAHGYGMKAKGMGGAATAMASDAMGGANNPASMVFAGDRLDVGMDLFAPKRKISRSGSTAGLNGEANSDSNLFYVPEFGVNRLIGTNKNMSLGITVYGNGGMNTDFPGGQIPGGNATCPNFLGSGSPAGFNLLCGDGRLGVDLMQVIFAPTFAIKLNKDHALGISWLIGHQQFKAYGIQSFGGFSQARNNLSNLGRDKANGHGLRFGWMGQMSDSVTLGAAYSTKIKMSRFDLYKGLFAEDGDFDIPENWNIGIAAKITPKLKVAADIQQINYGDVRSVANPSTNGGATIANTLGCPSCRGFGWSSIEVFKVGFEYQSSDAMTWRAGINRSKNPIQSRDVTFNFLAPGVVQNHYTVGFTYNMTKEAELTVAYMHAAKNSVSGSSLFNTFTGNTAGTDTIEMSQNSLGIAAAYKF